MGADFSKEIYDKYFNVKDRMVEVTLKDNTVLEGILVSFFHGGNEIGGPFIVRWHFIDKKDIEAYHKGLDVSLDGNQDMGRIIEQKDIKGVRFKV